MSEEAQDARLLDQLKTQANILATLCGLIRESEHELARLSARLSQTRNEIEALSITIGEAEPEHVGASCPICGGTEEEGHYHAGRGKLDRV